MFRRPLLVIDTETTGFLSNPKAQPWEIDAIRGQIVAVVRFDPSIKRSSPWRAGHPLHFYPATSIQPLRTPIAHRGAQGWPFLPPEVEAQVWAAV